MSRNSGSHEPSVIACHGPRQRCNKGIALSGDCFVKGWRLRLRYYWVDHHVDVVAAFLCVAIAGVLGGASTWFDHPDLGWYRLTPPPKAHLIDGTIIGFVGRSGQTAYVRTSSNRYGIVRLPFFSGYHNGDRIALIELRGGGRTTLEMRDPASRR